MKRDERRAAAADERAAAGRHRPRPCVPIRHPGR